MQGSRQSDAFSLSRHNLMPFINKLHHSLHLPEVGGLATGTLFMGLLAVAWVLDCVRFRFRHAVSGGVRWHFAGALAGTRWCLTCTDPAAYGCGCWC